MGEEISEDESSNEEYEDDFEDEFYTEDDLDEVDEDLEDEYPFGRRAELGHLSTVREEQDFTRVMSNYEQDLQRMAASDRLLGASPPPAAVPSAASLGRASAGAPPATSVADVQTRACRLREELMRKMGSDTSQMAFDFLVLARRDNVDERQVRR